MLLLTKILTLFAIVSTVCNVSVIFVLQCCILFALKHILKQFNSVLECVIHLKHLELENCLFALHHLQRFQCQYSLSLAKADVN
jgi:hypothetical protein